MAEFNRTIREDFLPIIIGLALILTYCYLTLSGRPVSDDFKLLVTTVVMLYFGKNIHTSGVTSGERASVNAAATVREIENGYEQSAHPGR